MSRRRAQEGTCPFEVPAVRGAVRPPARGGPSPPHLHPAAATPATPGADVQNGRLFVSLAPSGRTLRGYCPTCHAAGLIAVLTSRGQQEQQQQHGLFVKRRPYHIATHYI